MAQITWKDIKYEPVPIQSAAFNAAAALGGGFDDISAALTKMEADKQKQVGMAGIGEAMKLTTADAFNKAATEGRLKMTAETLPFFVDRAKKLADVEQTGVQTEGLKLDNQGKVILQEGWKIDNQGKIIDNKGKLILQEGYKIDNAGKLIDNEGKVIKNETDVIARDVAGYNFEQTKKTDEAKLRVAPILAQISEAGNSGTEAGRQKANALAEQYAADLIQAGASLDGVAGINDRTLERIGAGIQTNEALFKAGTTAADNADTAAGTKIFQELYNNNSFVNPEDAKEAIRNGPGSVGAKTKAMALVDANKDILYHPYDARKSIIDQGIKEGVTPTAPRDVIGGALLNQVVKTESQGKWDALFGQSQEPGKAFAGTQVSRMTLGQLDQMAPQYGAYVKDRNGGTTATPMGMFQIVNTTLQQAAKELGMGPDTVFDADTQLKLFVHLADKRLMGPRSMQGMLNGIREEWAGLKNVDDSTLVSAINDYRSGNKDALTGLLGSGGGDQQGNAASIEKSLAAAANTDQPLGYYENDSLYQMAAQRDAYATSLIQQMTIDKSFGGQQEAVLNSFLHPKDTSIGDRDDIIKAGYESSGKSPDEATRGQDYDNFQDQVARIEKYGLTTDQAVNLIKGATGEAGWWKLWKYNDIETVESKIDEYIGQIIDLKEKDPEKRMQGAVTKLAEIAAKNQSATNIQQLQADYQGAMTDYYSAAERRRAGQKVDDKAALKRVLAMGQRLQMELDRVNKSATTRANSNALQTMQ